MPAQRIGNLLNGSLKRAGIYPQVTAAQIMEELNEIVRTKWGEGALNRISPKHVQNGVLTIRVKDSVYSAELKLAEVELIKKINKRCKGAAVKKLRLLVK